jgi:uncharacterized protein (DUF2336 family)
MVVQHFLKWIETARVSDRAAAAGALARAFVVSELSFEDRCAAEAALTLLLDDPSPKVRLAMAESLSLSLRAPPHIIAALAADQPEVAALVIVRSPLLSDIQLIELVAAGCAMVRRFVAMRPAVSPELAAAIAEVGDAETCLELLCNSGAAIASLSLRRMAERHGHEAELREALLADARLPADSHHLLLMKLGQALQGAPLVRALMGAARAERITRDACLKASITLIDATPAAERGALVAHLRVRGELTTSFLVRVVAHGKIDFFGAVLVALTGQGEERVGGILSAGRDVALQALFRTAGIGPDAQRVILRAVKLWREVAAGRSFAGPQEVSWLMLRELREATAAGEASAAAEKLVALLNAIHLEALRENARGHALSLAAA